MEVDPSPIYQAGQSVLSEVKKMYQHYVDKLFDENVDKVLEGCKQIKDYVIGNNKQKTNFIVLGAVPRLVYLINNENTSTALKTQCAIILGSLAKGIDTNVKNLVDYGVITAMCSGLCSTDLKFYEACIRCLRTIIIASDNAIASELINSDIIVPQMLKNINLSTCTQVCTCEIISQCFKSTEQQNVLLGFGAICSLTNLVLETSISVVQINALKSLAVLCYKNAIICQQLADTKIGDQSFVDFLIEMLAKNNCKAKQLHAARCLAYMFKAEVIDLNYHDGIIAMKVLPCLIRMCSLSINEKIMGAKTVAFLTEDDCNLQRLSFICDQYPLKLEAFFKNPTVKDTKSPSEMLKFKQELKYGNELRAVGFLGYAALLSNDEDIRKQVANEILVKNISEALNDSNVNLRIAALKCLLSLSRSIHLLRTCIQDAHIFNNLIVLLKNSDKSIKETIVLSAILANFTLEFCPDKKELLSSNAMQYMCEWVNSEVHVIRLNGIWGLMNMTFGADVKLKEDILEALGFKKINDLLANDKREMVARTLGLLRNILSNSADCNTLLAKYGFEIVNSCQLVMETISNFGTGNPNLHQEYEVIRMHAVCVLSSVAASTTSKTFLITNEDLLLCVISYLGHFHIGLQKASVSLIYNLVKCTEVDFVEHQELLTRLDANSILEQLKSTTDKELADLVNQTLQQFEGQK